MEPVSGSLTSMLNCCKEYKYCTAGRHVVAQATLRSKCSAEKDLSSYLSIWHVNRRQQYCFNVGKQPSVRTSTVYLHQDQSILPIKHYAAQCESDCCKTNAKCCSHASKTLVPHRTACTAASLSFCRADVTCLQLPY